MKALSLGISLLVPWTAWAAEENGTEGAADESAQGSAEASTKTDDPSVVPTATRADVSVDEPRRRSSRDGRWIHRWAPERNMAELGAFGGVYQAGGDHELFEPDSDLPDQGFQTYSPLAGEIGGRLGFYPSRFFGVEAEGGVMPTETRAFERATMWNVRGSLVGQVGKWSLTPFALVGAGALGVRSSRAAVGNDVDPSLHFGGGLKAYLSQRAQVRVDVRDVISHQQGVENGFRNHGLEALLGVSVTLGRTGKARSDDSQCTMSDSDGDGFLDINDECVNEAGVAPHGCPVLDSDGDGFLDDADECIDEPGVMPAGCPIRDTDEDGLLDPVDQCIAQPETVNGFQDTDGCPDELPTELTAFNGIMQGIRFQTDKAIILPRSRPRLDHAAELMLRFSEIRVEIIGHTDSKGDHDYNIDLSRRRADAVRAYLTDRGVAADRLRTRGAGPNEPIAENKTKQGRARNRRIEFKMLTNQDGK